RAVLFERPPPHLVGLADHLTAPADLWVTTDQELEALTAQRTEQKAFLEILGHSASGDLAAVFDKARSLAGGGTRETSSPALTLLLQPHLRQAQEAIAKANRGEDSTANWQVALRAATTARMLDPTSPEPWRLLGEISIAQGQVESAKRHFDAAIERDPTHLDALLGTARVARLRHDLESAESALREAARHHPRTWRGWHNLGAFLFEQDRNEEAVEAFQRATAIPDAPPMTHLSLGETYLDQGSPALALLESGRLLAIERSADALYLRGRAHYELDQLDRALQDFKQAVLLEANHVGARGGISQVLVVTGDLHAARESLQSVLALDPTNIPARENLQRIDQTLSNPASP
ncbi:MAG: tetratricopeptide repeat protein, partial [Myxococcota bacterium]|nr:tetratricopeptide repeat protein [Myxococcota bacterium]